MSECVWNIGGMILTGETRSTGMKPVPVPLRQPHLPHAVTFRLNPNFRDERAETNRLIHGKAKLRVILHFK